MTSGLIRVIESSIANIDKLKAHLHKKSTLIHTPHHIKILFQMDNRPKSTTENDKIYIRKCKRKFL